MATENIILPNFFLEIALFYINLFKCMTLKRRAQPSRLLLLFHTDFIRLNKQIYKPNFAMFLSRWTSKIIKTCIPSLQIKSQGYIERTLKSLYRLKIGHQNKTTTPVLV